MMSPQSGEPAPVLPFEGQESSPDHAETGSSALQSSTGTTNWLPAVLAAFGVVVMVHTLLRAMRRNKTRSADMLRPPAERLADLRQEANRRREPVEALMADAAELCQRLASQLDAKAARLEQLLADADRAITRLEGREPPARHAAPTPGDGLRMDAFTASGPRPRPSPDVEPVQAKVYALADQGLTPRQIAEQLEQPQGHVELMLNLRRA